MSKLEVIERLSLLAAKNVLTLDDVAMLTGYSRSHLYKLTSAREIPHYKHNGKQLFFDRAEVEQWLKQGKVSTDAEIEQRAAGYQMSQAMKGGRV